MNQSHPFAFETQSCERETACAFSRPPLTLSRNLADTSLLRIGPTRVLVLYNKYASVGAVGFAMAVDVTHADVP